MQNWPQENWPQIEHKDSLNSGKRKTSKQIWDPGILGSRYTSSLSKLENLRKVGSMEEDLCFTKMLVVKPQCCWENNSTFTQIYSQLATNYKNPDMKRPESKYLLVLGVNFSTFRPSPWTVPIFHWQPQRADINTKMLHRAAHFAHALATSKPKF